MIPIKNFSAALLLPALFLFSCKNNPPANPEAKSASLQVRPGDCDDPDANINCYFVNMPATLSHIMSICGEEEPGERLHLRGTVYKADGKTPLPDVLLYAYHTNNKGIYAQKGKETGVQKWHGYLHGWCRTDQNGRYEIQTIRPASYPKSTAPAHIHAAVKIPGGGKVFYINDFVFKDDPYVSERESSDPRFPGGPGMVDVVKSEKGVWTGVRNLVLSD